ncbi:Coronin-like protein crn1 [Cyphellophora attinorum]|uniref:Coronin n=1 Tax=Cyphellophora attinorum TaxID=1664694 RepID=A0A0N1NYA6_9EURO|nr:Coronin-like protein crn1 [Phialophora attinorum]KPI39467.1 Coronin-like protein crn1 [Phialophora attinorum]
MAGRFVRSSKFRHVFGRPTRKNECYDNLKVSRNAWDSNLLKANPDYLAVNWDSSGGGAFAVIPTGENGRLPDRIPLFRGHTAVVLDTDWNPFNDSLVASGSDDGKVFLWRVPDGFTLRPDVPADQIEDVAPVGKLSGHPKKVGHVLFNPAAENVLASTSGDFTVKLWDIESGSSKLTLKVGEVIQSLSWSANGSLLVTTSRDKKLLWMGEHDRIATTGFSKMSDRQLALWDIKAPTAPVNGFEMLDSISGVCVPFWDQGTSCLYLAGKGDGNIRYYEYENDKFEYLSEYKSSDAQRGIAFLPKRGVNMHENEVMRAYKTVNDTYIEPISFIVPRRAESFQEDIYPPTFGLKPAMSSAEWFDGAEKMPPKINMESLYDGDAPEEIPASAAKPTPKAAEPEKAPESKKETPKPAPEPTPAARAPPASMKEQGSSMMAMASKFEDKEPVEDNDDDASSFEEVQKPIERSAIKSPVTQTVPKPAESPKVATPAPKSPEPEKVSEPEPEAPLPLTTTTSSETASSPTASSADTEGLQREIKNMKTLMAQQTRQLATLARTVQELTAEVKNLKSR